MDRQVVSSVWEYESKYDLYIDKFLELLLKYGYIWCEQDEKDFRTNLSNDDKRLLANDFREFQKGLTSFDIAIQVKNIRKLYKKELLELEKSGKDENGSILPWFSKAQNLFSDKTDKENEILKHENISVSSDEPSATTSVATFLNHNGKFNNSSALSPKQVPPSSKTKQTPIRNSISTTTTLSYLHNVSSSLAENAKPYAVGLSAKSTKDLKDPKPVLKATKCIISKSPSGMNSTISVSVSPFEMTTTSSKIRHPFSPPTSVSPASRIPMRRSFTSSTAGASVRPTSTSSTSGVIVRPTTSSTIGANVRPTTSSTSGVNVRTTTSSTARTIVRSTISSTPGIISKPTTSSTAGANARPTTSSSTGAIARPTTSSSTGAIARPTTSSTAGAIVRPINSSTSGDVVKPTNTTPNKAHMRHTTSSTVVAPLQLTTSSTIRVPVRHITAPSIARAIARPTTSSPVRFPVRPTSTSSTVGTNVRLATTSPGKAPVLSATSSLLGTFVCPTSPIVGAPKRSINALSVTRILSSPAAKYSSDRPSFSSATKSSSIRISLSKTAPSRVEVLLPQIGTPCQTRVPRPATTIVSRSKGPIIMNAQSSSVGPLLKPNKPATSCRRGVPVSLVVSHSRNKISSSKIAPAPSPGVSKPAHSSCRSGVSGISTPTYPTSNSNILKPTYPPISPSSSILAYDSSNPGVSPPYHSDVFAPSDQSCSSGVSTQTCPSSNSGVSLPDYQSPKVDDYTSATASSSPSVLTTPPLSSRNEIPLIPYRYTPPYSLAVPVSATASPPSANVSISRTSVSPSTGVVMPSASFSSNGLPLSPTTPIYKSRLPFSKTASCPKTPVPVCTIFAASPPPQISPLKYPLSP